MNSKTAKGQGTQRDLGSAPLPGLILKFAVPSIISMLVTALYNLTDQVFIGHIVGVLGNAATNVVFPLTTFCTATSQLAAIGAAANFNIHMGKGQKDEARQYVGNGLTLLALFGLAVFLVVTLFRTQVLYFCGATETVLPYADVYLTITGFGLPFFLFSNGSAIVIRADGSPRYSMICTVSGALLNILLDYIFMVPLGLGIQGAALATLIGQLLSFGLTILYFPRFRAFRITRENLTLKARYAVADIKLGVSNFLNLTIMTAVNVILNNTLTYYGAMTVYGSDIPLAVSGIVNKIQMILTSFVVGTAQGCQPILSFNMGAGEYRRVRDTYKIAVTATTILSVIAFILFQLFPDQITNIFGSGDELYYQFSSEYLKTYLGAVFLFGFQPITVNYFTSIGNVRQGIILSVSRQGLFLILLILILPVFFGLNGILYAGPIAETLAFLLSITMAHASFKRLKRLEAEKAANAS